MNNDQRKYLVKQVEKTCSDQVEELRNQMPKKPSLNNYLIASFLDNSIQFNDIEILKDKMRQSVINFGTNDVLVKEEDDDGFYRRKRNVDGKTVSINAEDLFIIPESYKKALAEYQQKKDEIESKIKEVTATANTIIMKINVGSNTVLDKLVVQIDNMGDLDLLNTQLLISGTTADPKMLKQ